jgi:hypothetical protein
MHSFEETHSSEKSGPPASELTMNDNENESIADESEENSKFMPKTLQPNVKKVLIFLYWKPFSPKPRSGVSWRKLF